MSDPRYQCVSGGSELLAEKGGQRDCPIGTLNETDQLRQEPIYWSDLRNCKENITSEIVKAQPGESTAVLKQRKSKNGT